MKQISETELLLYNRFDSVTLVTGMLLIILLLVDFVLWFILVIMLVVLMFDVLIVMAY